MKNKSIASLSLRKLLLSALVAAPLATLPVPLQATPADQATLNSLITPSSGVSATWISANRVDVTSTATNGVLKWTDFGGGTNLIGSGDVINFSLPSTSASILNMVTGTNSTTISGKLTANGNLYVLNPNGITVGGTGVITANSVGLSSIPETEYYFLNTGTLSYSTNNNTSVTSTVNVNASATITAASGTGNIYIAGKGGNYAGTLDAGNVTVSSINGGAVVLASGGSLTVGDATNKVGNVTVTTDAATGTITIGDATPGASTTIYGPSVSLTSTNALIKTVGTGAVTIGSGTANATLTTNSGTADTDFSSATISAAGSKTLTANATTKTAGLFKITTNTGDLAFGGSVAGAATLTANSGNITLNTSTVGGVLTADASLGGGIKSGGTVTNTAGTAIILKAKAANDIVLAVANDIQAGTLTLSGPADTFGNVTLSSTGGAITVDPIAAANITITAKKAIAQSGTGTLTATGGNVSLTSTTAGVALSQAITAGNLTVNGNTTVGQTVADNISNSVSLTSGTTLSIGAALIGAGTLPTLTTSSGTTTTISTPLTVTTANITATGALAIGGVLTAGTLNATADTMTQTAAIVSSGVTTLNGNTSITLNGSNDFTTLVLKNAPSGVTLTDINGVVLGNGTTATGNVIITASTGAAGDVVFGAAAADTLSFGRILTINNTTVANGNITDVTNNTAVTGNVTLSVAGTGVVTLDGNTGTGVGLNSSYGQMNVTTAGTNATVASNSALNLGTINLGAGVLTAYSAASISNTGVLTVAGAKVGAGTNTAPGDIALNYVNSAGTVTNAIGGTGVTILTDSQMLGSSNVGNYLVKNLWISNGTSPAALVSIPNNIYGSGITGNVTLRAYGAAALNAGAINTTGAVSLQSDTGAITVNTVGTASAPGNTFKTVSVTTNSTGASTITTYGDLTVNGNVSNTSTGSLTFTSGGALTIGSYYSLGSGPTSATTFAAAATGKVSDSNPGIFIFGDVSFTGGSVSVTQSGHNFGKITIDTSAKNGAATIVEGGTLNIASVKTGSGAFSATSANGDILENAGAGSIISTGAISLSAANGAVTANGAANSVGNVTLTAMKDSTLKNTAATILGTSSITTGGLTVSDSGAGTDITQKSGATIYTYGATNLTATGAGNVTLDQSGNQFGNVTITTGSGAVTVKESTTLNLGGITTIGGKVTATSENGDIVDSGALTVGTSAVSFNAAKGNVLLTKSSTFASAGTVGVSFNTAGNVTVKSAGAIQFDTSTVSGNFTASATGNMSQLGALTVAKDVALTPSGSIMFTNTANQFGTVRFTTSGNSIIDSANTFNLKAGSFATAAVTINTGADFMTTGTGGSSFTGSGLTINAASGTIRPSAGSLLVTGTLTTFSNVVIDLSALSLSGNLNNVTPVHSGTATYTAPGQ